MKAKTNNLKQGLSSGKRQSIACFFFSSKREELVQLFLISAGGIFLLTGLAKIISSFGIAPILDFPDPLLGISFRHDMLLVGAMELIISTICIFGDNIKLQVGLVAWVATSFVIYHWGLSFIGWLQPCSCFGNIMDGLHMAPAVVDLLVKCLLTYLLAASYLSLILIWGHNKMCSVINSEQL